MCLVLPSPNYALSPCLHTETDLGRLSNLRSKEGGGLGSEPCCQGQRLYTQSLHRHGGGVSQYLPLPRNGRYSCLCTSNAVINPTRKLLEILRCGTEHHVECVISLGPHSSEEQSLGLTPELPNLAAHPLLFSFSFSVKQRPYAHILICKPLSNAAGHCEC